ncbi:SDR family oxidoreductase [Mycolicibacterium thermoresistibile]|uniref:Short-chain dehydrogenase/reductase SDR n=2 Tax=Mycolicibacterium thermoresistibile TaxID=1797 RepID=G7CN16_MYCT3|nr:SDR family oxidoreductase [Mycolicibacterium thermoresistibile]EHI10505.1 short-chain dehydrogenase/reductase SDR [Mycolicibacterium thermoresistibile ATCC 19527]MCV7189644.1 SDR family oxidoreductase [Mycolicibacterium thermoresistibile]GAT15443.1 short-chain dehydrogenase/reductase SDR [Mycolicibacterium thermoresistibile]SNW17502.1 short-chain dehydrogenase/reductase SDR [Mycolicibacterium thermoresistibile]
MSEPDRPLRVAVVGASAGLGRCIGVGLSERGAQVAMLARRRERLADAAREAGNGAVPVVCDVTDQGSCRRAMSEVVDALGRLDALVYTTGMGILSPLVEMTADQWAQLFATNVTGAALITAAAAPHLSAAGGSAVYLSSLSASYTTPWPRLGSYAVTKAALDKLVEAWRVEHPEIGFTRLAVGDSLGGTGDSQTEFNKSWDPAAFDDAVNFWMEHGYMQGGLVEADHLVQTVDAILRCGKSSFIPHLTLAPRPSSAVDDLR